VVSPRMVRVMGTTMISFRRSMTSSRVSRRTGRRLSGGRNAYQRIWPRLTQTAPSLAHPRPAVPGPPRTRRVKAGQPGRRKRHRPATLLAVSSVRAPLAAMTQPREGCLRRRVGPALLAFYQPGYRLRADLSVNEAVSEREAYQLPGRVKIELLHHAPAVGFHGVDAQTKRCGDLFIGFAFGDHL